jgi:glycosyltransferase involved in cell wall biosynthesis
MRIIFISDNFPPEYNAPATRTYEHCKAWVKLGVEVTVITCFPNFPRGKIYEGYNNRWKSVEYMDGIRVIRVWSFIAPNAGFFKRTLDFLSFAITSFLAGVTLKSDLIVATSPQFFSAVSGWALSLFKGKRWVMEVRDLWPESIKAVDALKPGVVLTALEKIEMHLYRSASKIIVVTDSFKSSIAGRGIDASKIYVVKNGVDLNAYQPQKKNDILLGELNLKNKFVVGYAGTHGLAHSLDFVVRCIDKLDDKSVHFIFIGDGAEKTNIVKQAEDLNLKNITFLNPVPKSEIAKYLSLMDVALIPLKKSTTFEGVIPSKVFETVAMHIPVLLGVDGETRRIIEYYQAGIFFEPENEIDFLAKLKAIKQKIQDCSSVYREGCQKMAHDFNRELLAAKMLDVLKTL